ncbi:MAG: indole-3-glycerol-phosphate synthase [Methanothrix sp.]|uniref:indole-3-glycerol-phosphate synthase n=1 Tax=Methanothrix harundinacea TaxID=301375 RepID=A0A101IIU7_9EURY|nr:MAG: indole-3-glycerol phosphate synthase [Methanosaeta sp. SDB]KUK44723.1 MAG: Indole-3-glycerol phosphate synthase [Methanothrix harundinacea]MDD3710018.1 indole-3-glycerol-phosphate synthase [Methanothrix sp.]MDI9399019.1 indole-3-glycerol-phosphate synthase [Euryarchaeota archaeon]KUK95944.1 MAG: Indole-3-glycerol phosphate synthase [Methanothrix harundinacea]
MTSDVVKVILRDTESRLAELSKPDPGARLKITDPRDLVGRAEYLRSRGVTPIIAEIKPRILNKTLTPQEVVSFAKNYEDMGACSISVLTQPTYFLGSLENARIARRAVGVPILRKDFILDERQLDEVESDLVLLIAAFSHPLNGLVEAAISRNMEPLVEVHNEAELEEALKTDARIVGINNRNLATLEVDLGTFERLGPVAKAAGLFVVAESGMNSRGDVLRMVEAGADALLVGTSLMEEPKLLLALNGTVAHGDGALKRAELS